MFLISGAFSAKGSSQIIKKYLNISVGVINTIFVSFLFQCWVIIGDGTAQFSTELAIQLN